MILFACNSFTLLITPHKVQLFQHTLCNSVATCNGVFKTTMVFPVATPVDLANINPPPTPGEHTQSLLRSGWKN